MWKKLLTAALVTSMLILPVNSVSPAAPEEAPEQAQTCRLGSVPAQPSAEEAMSPALHALVLALMNHEAETFDLTDRALAWEGLYNMLSLYGQLDARSETGDGTLLLLAETVDDYAAALNVSLADLGDLPAGLQDRLTCRPSSGTYEAVCGEDSLSQIQIDRCQTSPDGLQLTGALVYVVDGSVLARFQAELQSRDNMLGYAVTALTLTA